MHKKNRLHSYQIIKYTHLHIKSNEIIDNSGTKRLLMVIHSMLSTFLLVGLRFVVHKHFWQFFTVGKKKEEKRQVKNKWYLTLV